jgi:Tn3 transposase DDE domain
MAAHCRSVWGAGNFREGELQHVVRGLVRVDVYVAAFSLDGLMEQGTELDTTVCYTDTHGYTEVVMATAALLGYELAPRIKDIKDQTHYKMDRQQQYANLDPILSGTIKPHVIRKCLGRDGSSDRLDGGTDRFAVDGASTAWFLCSPEQRLPDSFRNRTCSKNDPHFEDSG